MWWCLDQIALQSGSVLWCETYLSSEERIPGTRTAQLGNFPKSSSHHGLWGPQGQYGTEASVCWSLLREKKPLRSVYLEMTLTYICKILIDFSLKWCLSFLCYHPRFTRVHLSSAIGLQWCQSLRILVCMSDIYMRKDPHIWSLKCFLDYLCLWFCPLESHWFMAYPLELRFRRLNLNISLPFFFFF